jgi:hypothetical protein
MQYFPFAVHSISNLVIIVAFMTLLGVCRQNGYDIYGISIVQNLATQCSTLLTVVPTV